MKFSVRGHEFEVLPGFLLTQIGWFVVNFTMGFLGIPWPNVVFHAVATLSVVVISAYNVTIDGKEIWNLLTEGEEPWESEKR